MNRKEAPREQGIVLFDGVCTLCNHTVQFILRRDPNGYFQFASLQGDAGMRLLRQCGLDPSQMLSVILVEGGHAYLRSAAILRVLRRLGFPWNLVYWAILVPRPIRDGIYALIARKRYRWFGQLDACPIPQPQWTERFLD